MQYLGEGRNGSWHVTEEGIADIAPGIGSPRIPGVAMADAARTTPIAYLELLELTALTRSENTSAGLLSSCWAFSRSTFRPRAMRAEAWGPKACQGAQLRASGMLGAGAVDLDDGLKTARVQRELGGEQNVQELAPEGGQGWGQG